MALTLDEAALLLEREDVYWSNEQLPLLTLLSTLTGALGLGARFLVQGHPRACGPN